MANDVVIPQSGMASLAQAAPPDAPLEMPRQSLEPGKASATRRPPFAVLADLES